MEHTVHLADDKYHVVYEYEYKHKPAILSSDPDDCCADESELNVCIISITPEPGYLRMLHIEAIMDGEEIQDKCIEHYHNTRQ